MGNLVKPRTTFRQHIHYWRANYVFLPYILALFVGFIYGVRFLTGRPITDDLDALVGMMLKVVQSLLVVILTDFTKPLLFEDFQIKEETSWWKHLIDTGETIFLFISFSVLVFSFFR